MVNQTDASCKHHLSLDRPHKLHVTLTNLSLENSEGNIVLRWQYEYIRSYGSHKAKGTFNVSSGRKAVSGEGDFEFVLQNPTRVTQAIDLQTKRKYQAKQEAQLQAEAMPLRTQSLNLSSGKDTADKDSTETKRASQKGVSSDFHRQLSDMIDPEKHDKQKKKTKEKEKEKEKKNEEKKSSFNLFGNRKKERKGSKQEVEAEKSSEGDESAENPEDHIYDEAVPTTTPKTKNGARVIPRTNVNEEIDDMYDSLGPKGGPKTDIIKTSIQKTEEGLYGAASGRPLNLETEEDNQYASAYDDTCTRLFEEEEVEYDDATSVPSRVVQDNQNYLISEYEQVDFE